MSSRPRQKFPPSPFPDPENEMEGLINSYFQKSLSRDVQGNVLLAERAVYKSGFAHLFAQVDDYTPDHIANNGGCHFGGKCKKKFIWGSMEGALFCSEHAKQFPAEKKRMVERNVLGQLCVACSTKGFHDYLGYRLCKTHFKQAMDDMLEQTVLMTQKRKAEYFEALLVPARKPIKIRRMYDMPTDDGSDTE